jgi:sulfonate transport system substrate-binding protein
MTHTTRRALLASGFALGAALAGPALAQPSSGEFRIGYQKTGLPVIARRQGSIEKRLAAVGITVKWVEFTAGPPLLEAMNAGAVDLGFTGDAPPIFAQAAGANILYVAALPSNGAGEALIAKTDSAIHTLSDLKGKKVGFTKGSSAHNLTVAALEKAGLSYGDITPIYLSPADAAAAFARGSIEAWAIWDPFFALAEQRYHPRVLTTSKDALHVNTYFLANKAFAERQPRVVVDALAGFGDAASWAAAHRGEVARALAEITGVDLAAQTVAAERTDFGVLPLSDEIIANQQVTADRFHKLGLIPKAINIRGAVWARPAT